MNKMNYGCEGLCVAISGGTSGIGLAAALRFLTDGARVYILGRSVERGAQALRYLEENPETRAVLSGGQGQGEQISEAEAMYQYLTEHGIDGSRLILEDRSANTKENLDFSLEKIGTLDASIGIVTNHFHVFRGVAIGRKCGCRRIYPIPARYRSWRLFIYVPREILAITKDKIVGNL